MPDLSVPTSPPSAPPSGGQGVQRQVTGDPERVLGSLTLAEIERVEADTGRVLSDVIATADQCLKSGQGLPMWAGSVVLYALTIREYPEITWAEFQATPWEDATGRVIQLEG